MVKAQIFDATLGVHCDCGEMFNTEVKYPAHLVICPKCRTVHTVTKSCEIKRMELKNELQGSC